MLGVYGALLALGVRLPEPAGPAWRAQTPVRLAAAAALTALPVSAFRRFERPTPLGPTADSGGPLAALGITLALLGVLGLSITGFGGLLEGHTATLVAVQVTAPAAAATVLAGWVLVERAGRAQPLPRPVTTGPVGAPVPTSFVQMTVEQTKLTDATWQLPPGTGSWGQSAPEYAEPLIHLPP